MEKEKVTKVVGVAIRSNGRYLCVQRGVGNNPETSLKFEFPGGKVRPGECLEEALHRELIEELNLDVTIRAENHYAQSFYEYKSGTVQLDVFLIDVQDIPFTLKEHVASKWLQANQLKDVPWSPADFPIVCKLADETW